MKIEVIGGIEYEVGTPAHADACRRRDDEQKQRTDAAAKTQAALDKLTARADAADAEVAKLRKTLADATSPQRLDHAVKVRAAVVNRARVVLGGEYKADGKTLDAIKREAVAQHFPDVKLDGKSRDYVNAMFRAIPKDARADGADRPLHLDGDGRIPAAPPALRNPPPNFQRTDGKTGGKGVTLDDIRARRDSAEEDRHRRPLAVTKTNPAREMDGNPAVQGSMLETMR